MNYFEQIADQQLTGAAKARHRAAEKRAAKTLYQSERDAPLVPGWQEKAQIENSQLLRGWRKWRRDLSDRLLEGAHGREYRSLLQLLTTLSPDSAPALVAYVERCKWVQDLEPRERVTILAMIDDKIVDLRIKQGLPPFDDSLLGEPATAFELCRFYLTGVGCHH